jgi:hypothetical protein
MGDDEGKSAEQVGLKSDSNGLTEVLPTQPSSVDQSLPAGIVGTPFKVLNGASQALSVGDVVLPIDGEDSKLSGISVEENGKTKKPLSGLRTINGAVISFCDVGYSVEVRTRSRGCTCRTNSQFILKNVRYVWLDSLCTTWLDFNMAECVDMLSV